MKNTNAIRTLVAGLALAMSTTAISAATLTFEWSLQLGADKVTGLIRGLEDNTRRQSVTGFEVTSSTLGGVGVYDLALADRNRNFKVENGEITAGHLFFRAVGDRTVDSPEIRFRINWRQGELNRFFFRAHTGERGGRTRLDISNPDTVASISTVPVPAGLPLLLAGVSGLALMPTKQRKSQR